MKRKIFEQATDDRLPPVPRDEELVWKRQAMEAERRGYDVAKHTPISKDDWLSRSDGARHAFLEYWRERQDLELSAREYSDWVTPVWNNHAIEPTGYEYDDTAINDADTWQAVDDDKPVCVHWIWPLLLGVLLGLVVIGGVVIAVGGV